MDIEELAIRYIQGDAHAGDELHRALLPEELEALIQEVRASGEGGSYVLDMATTGFTAGSAGLGCRGSGDAIVHRAVTGLFPPDGLSIPPSEMDDSGAVPFAGGHIVVSVDGIHSRLSRFPFIAGFHAARAALRDVMVKGARPLALTSDVHLANDADVGAILDLSAGISAVSVLTAVPVAGGSTLRIGGDMVRGTRLTGSVGAVGFAERLAPRRDVAAGDVLISTVGSGGGTIATTAIYNGMHRIVGRTLNVDFFRDIRAMLEPGVHHALLDITNGGIRGDASDLVSGRALDIVLDGRALRGTVDPTVLGMLDALGIDPIGISTDAILAVVPTCSASAVLASVEASGGRAVCVGRVVEGAGRVILETAEGSMEIRPPSREAPYTPIKKVVSRRKVDLVGLSRAVDEAAGTASRKAARVLEEVRHGPR
ncbi:MAG: AIR synthase related protein [Thermoplasmata archaeon]|nr:AIR synthase related protein [Thermoplasmata archaeon]